MSEAAQRIWTPEAEASSPRLFSSDNDVEAIAQGLLARTLPRECWTHEAHIAATLWLIRYRPDLDLPQALPSIIRRYNESVGGVNDDAHGYHETVTQAYVRGLSLFADGQPAAEAISTTVNSALTGAIGRRDWLLSYYSRERLFSVEARRSFVEPDLTPF